MLLRGMHCLILAYLLFIAANPVGKVVTPRVSRAVEDGRRKVLQGTETASTLRPVTTGTVDDLQELLTSASTQVSAHAGWHSSASTFRVADPLAYSGVTLNRQLKATSFIESV